jgi:hypothetical protein
MKFRILFLWIFITASLGFTSLVVFENNDTFYWLAYGFAILFVLVFSLAFTFVMVAYFKVRLSNEGVKGFNVFGGAIYIEWINISNVKTINLLGLKFLRVFPKGTLLALWLPLFINNPDDFAKKSSYIPPEGNDFREFFSSKYG